MFQFPPLTPLVKKISLAVGISTVLVLLLDRLFGLTWLLPALVLSRHGTGQLGTPIAWLWQVFTHAFVYPPEQLFGAVLGLLFFWYMGAPFEIRFGARTLLKLLIVSVLASAVGGIMAMVLLPGQWGAGAVWGVSALLIGVITGIAASSTLSAQVSFFGLFQMTQKALLISFAVAIVLFGIADGNYVAIVAQFAAGFAAYFYMKALLTPRAPKPKKKKARRAHNLSVIEGGVDDDDDMPKWLN